MSRASEIATMGWTAALLLHFVPQMTFDLKIFVLVVSAGAAIIWILERNEVKKGA